MVTSNAAPSVSWVSPADGVVESGSFTLVGLATPDVSGSATIAKWCLTVSGPTSVILPELRYSTDPAAIGSGYTTPLNRDVNGCYVSTANIRKVWLSFNSTSWVNGTYNFTAQVTDSSGRVSTVTTKVIESQKPRPSSSFNYSNSGFDGVISYQVLQPQTTNGNPAVGFRISVDGEILCTGSSLTNNLAKCIFGNGQVSNGAHTAGLELVLRDGQIYSPIAEQSFISNLVDRPRPTFGSSSNKQLAYEVSISIPIISNSSTLAIREFNCFVGSSTVPVSTKAALKQNLVACSPSGTEAPPGIHTLRVVLELADGQFIENTYPFSSSSKVRPLPVISKLNYSQSDWIGNASAAIQNPKNVSPCKTTEFFVNDLSLGRVLQSKTISTVSDKVNSSEVSNGAARLLFRCTTTDGRVLELGKSIQIDLLVPPPAPSTIVWNQNLDGSTVWKTGYNASFGGTVVKSTDGTLTKSLKARTYQLKKGWSAWKTFKVNASGTFNLSLYAESALRVQVLLPKTNRTPESTHEVRVPVYGTVSVSGPSRANSAYQITRKITVRPKWLTAIYCEEFVTYYNYAGAYLGSSAYETKIKLSNGVGYYKKRFPYPYTRILLNCEVVGSGLTRTSLSSDSLATVTY